MKREKKNFTASDLPASADIRAELNRVNQKNLVSTLFGSTVRVLVLVAAITILIATVFLPVMRVYGSSMSPTLHEGNVVVTLKDGNFKQGDVVGLYVGNKLLVKRVIAGPGQYVDIDENGIVKVDGEVLIEPYIVEPAYGDVNIKLPYQVPEDRYFVMGDHRATSADSRNTAVGCISKDQILGRVLFRIWPLNQFGSVQAR